MAENEKKDFEGHYDYKKLGFLCGLEIHQRLATDEKLFCSCPTSIVSSSAKPTGSIMRFQRAVAGELGAVDKSAEFEEERKRSFTYNTFRENTCLVDVDEEPPHNINMHALEISLAVASSMGMRIIDEVQPMRKAVVDGSDPSAFQRTILIGLDGKINVNGLNVNIPFMSLEEESCGIVHSTSTSVFYNTDRLGIPLIEIDTDPNIPNPKAAKDVAHHIGTLLRLTGLVQRGIGSIRQDVNMSIKDGARVEIKGVQELGLIDRFLDNEIKRQQNLVSIKKKLVSTKARVGEPVDVTKIFEGTYVEVIKAHGKEVKVYAVALHGFRGLLGMEINPNRRLGTEISDYAKMAGVKGIIHSDENLTRYKFREAELNELRKQLKITEKDSFILVAGREYEARKAIRLAIWRAKYAMEGIPRETRAAYDSQNYTTRFMRPLPGGSRMYPETDVKPILVTNDMINNASANAPNVEKERKFLKSLVKNNAILEQLLLSPRLQIFKRITERTKADPEFVANVLIQKLTEMRRNGIDVDRIEDDAIDGAFKAYADGRITKQAVEEVLKLSMKHGVNIDLIIKESDLGRISGKELKEIISKERKESRNAKTDELRSRIMSKYRLRIDGSELNRELGKK